MSTLEPPLVLRNALYEDDVTNILINELGKLNTIRPHVVEDKLKALVDNYIEVNMTILEDRLKELIGEWDDL